VEERRSGAGREGVGCDAMFGDVGVWVVDVEAADAINRVEILARRQST
jgi:hypothetical protein